MGTAIKHPLPDRARPSFVTFDIRALWRSGLMSNLNLWPRPLPSPDWVIAYGDPSASSGHSLSTGEIYSTICEWPVIIRFRSSIDVSRSMCARKKAIFYVFVPSDWPWPWCLDLQSLDLNLASMVTFVQFNAIFLLNYKFLRLSYFENIGGTPWRDVWNDGHGMVGSTVLPPGEWPYTHIIKFITVPHKCK